VKDHSDDVKHLFAFSRIRLAQDRLFLSTKSRVPKLWEKIKPGAEVRCLRTVALRGICGLQKLYSGVGAGRPIDLAAPAAEVRGRTEAKMKKGCCRVALVIGSTWFSASVPAVVFYATGDSYYNTGAPAGALAGSGWELQGDSFPGIPIAPN